MKKFITVTTFTLSLMSCVSVEDVQKNAFISNDIATVSIDSVERTDSYTSANRTLTASKPEKDNVIVIEASFINNGQESVTVAPWATGLQPRIEKYGLLPSLVGFFNPGESFVNGISGRTGESDFELEPGEAGRRVFIFIYPKDREPDALNLQVLSANEKPVLWVSSPLKK